MMKIGLDVSYEKRNGVKEMRKRREGKGRGMSGYADGQRVGTVWRGLAGWVAERARSQTSVCARLLLPPSERRGGCRSHDQRESGTPIMPSCKPMPL
ncbi:hypothetical protein Q7C36_023408 [Tachysurus vachellii]|uniref:Uncharacterized protein n=1 Tax=Tachysurus vachellii TaxID=175792 RepID=A0AA88LGH8_TACVA|nr:hypothetical protein Q7C36_023408 [Tachysurus vachellii]